MTTHPKTRFLPLWQPPPCVPISPRSSQYPPPLGVLKQKPVFDKLCPKRTKMAAFAIWGRGKNWAWCFASGRKRPPLQVSPSWTGGVVWTPPPALTSNPGINPPKLLKIQKIFQPGLCPNQPFPCTPHPWWGGVQPTQVNPPPTCLCIRAVH